MFRWTTTTTAPRQNPSLPPFPRQQFISINLISGEDDVHSHGQNNQLSSHRPFQPGPPEGEEPRWGRSYGEGGAKPSVTRPSCSRWGSLSLNPQRCKIRNATIPCFQRRRASLFLRRWLLVSVTHRHFKSGSFFISFYNFFFFFLQMTPISTCSLSFPRLI